MRRRAMDRPSPTPFLLARKASSVRKKGVKMRDEILLAVGSQVRLYENVVTAGVLLLREAADALPAIH